MGIFQGIQAGLSVSLLLGPISLLCHCTDDNGRRWVVTGGNAVLSKLVVLPTRIVGRKLHHTGPVVGYLI